MITFLSNFLNIFKKFLSELLSNKLFINFFPSNDSPLIIISLSLFDKLNLFSFLFSFKYPKVILSNLSMR